MPVAAPATVVGFRDPTRLGKWVVGLLCVFVGIATITALSDLWREWFLQSVVAGAWRSRGSMMETAQLIDESRFIISIAHVGLYVLAGILFLKWVHRCNGNARGIGVGEMSFTPGWAVGCYFVPFANLALPYKAMKELWTRSLGPSAPDAPAIVRLWWGLFLLNNLAGAVAGAQAFGAKTVDDLLLAGRISLVAQALIVAGAIVASLLVRRISANQVKHWRVSEVFA